MSAVAASDVAVCEKHTKLTHTYVHLCLACLPKFMSGPLKVLPGFLIILIFGGKMGSVVSPSYCRNANKEVLYDHQTFNWLCSLM